MGFPHVDHWIRSVALSLADDVHTGLASQCAEPVRIALAATSDRPIVRVAEPSIAPVAGRDVIRSTATFRRSRSDVHDHCDCAAGEQPGKHLARHGTTLLLARDVAGASATARG